jgi:hypothetical protein
MTDATARRKTRTLARAMTDQARLDKAERTATDAAARRDASVLEAQEAGNTYADLTDATGLSTARITQVLRRDRQRRTATA